MFQKPKTVSFPGTLIELIWLCKPVVKFSLPKSPKSRSTVFHHLVITTVPFWWTHCPRVFARSPLFYFETAVITGLRLWQMLGPFRCGELLKKKKIPRSYRGLLLWRRRSDISSFGCSYLIRRRDCRSDWLPLPLTYVAGKSYKFHVAGRFWSMLPYLIFGIVLWWQRSHIFGESEPRVGFPSGLGRN